MYIYIYVYIHILIYKEFVKQLQVCASRFSLLSVKNFIKQQSHQMTHYLKILIVMFVRLIMILRCDEAAALVLEKDTRKNRHSLYVLFQYDLNS